MLSNRNRSIYRNRHVETNSGASFEGQAGRKTFLSCTSAAPPSSRSLGALPAARALLVPPFASTDHHPPTRSHARSVPPRLQPFGLFNLAKRTARLRVLVSSSIGLREGILGILSLSEIHSMLIFLKLSPTISLESQKGRQKWSWWQRQFIFRDWTYHCQRAVYDSLNRVATSLKSANVGKL